MDFLLEHANHIAGGLMSYEALAMLHALDIEREVGLKFFWNDSISALEDYANWMRFLPLKMMPIWKHSKTSLDSKNVLLECCSISSQSSQYSRVHFK